VEIEVADCMPGGWGKWLKWEKIASKSGLWSREGDFGLLEADGGDNLTFSRVIARRREKNKSCEDRSNE